jgi:hypothetical protein
VSEQNFLFWLKGYLAALECSGKLLTKDDISIITIALEHAIKAKLAER